MATILMTYRVPLGEYAELIKDYDLVCPDKPLVPFSKEELLARLHDADALVCLSDHPCTTEMINAAPKLRVIATVSVGFNHIDLKTAMARHIPVVNTPHTVTNPTAELTLGLMFSCCRSLARYDRDLRRDLTWEQAYLPEDDTVLDGKTLGILGFGRIGRLVAKKAYALGMKIIYFDKFRAPAEVEQAVEAKMLPAEEVIKTADILTLHMPYLPENHHFINAERIAMMKPSAYLINAARGALVCEEDLIAALREKRIRGAGLDVFEHEPHLNPEFATLDNVVLTPHIGTKMASIRLKMLGEALEGMTAVLRGETPTNLVRG